MPSFIPLAEMSSSLPLPAVLLVMIVHLLLPQTIVSAASARPAYVGCSKA